MVEHAEPNFLDQFRVEPIQQGDKIKHRNFGVGVVIATCNDKCWVIFEDGRDRLFKIESLVKSILVKVTY